MNSNIEAIKKKFNAALETENLDELQNSTKELVELYNKTPRPKQAKKKFGIEILEILSMKNAQGKTAVMIDVERGKGEIEENIYLFALESENFDMLQKLINGLVKAYQETTDGKKAYGMESLKIFNLQNSRGETAVMLAAKHDRTDLLKEWYDVPGNLTNVPYFPKELQEVYRLQVSSYIAQDNEGKNALMLAVKSGNSACFPFLLSPETAITLNQKDKNGDTPLVFVIKSKNFELIKEFLRVTEETLDNSKCEIKLEIDDDDISNCIQNIGSRRIKSLITRFLDRVNKNASPCSKPLPLKRKNTAHANTTPKKKSKEDSKIEKAVLKDIQEYIDLFEETKYKLRPESFTTIKEYIHGVKIFTQRCKNSSLNFKNEVHKKLENLEKKRQGVGKSRLEKLLNEANEPNLTDKKKEEILSDIKKLIIEAKIEFPEDLVQKIPSNMMYEVTDIITTGEKNKQLPNSQLHSATNELASCSHSLALQR